MFLNTFKLCLTVFFLSAVSYAQSVTFTLPDGWGKNEELSKQGEELVFTLIGEEKPKETLTITVNDIKAGADRILWNNFINIKKKYSDFKYYKPLYTPKNSIGVGCSTEGSFCTVQRVEVYEGDIYVYSYINTYPHYGQGLFGKWTNILGLIRAGEQEKTRETDGVFEI